MNDSNIILYDILFVTDSISAVLIFVSLFFKRFADWPFISRFGFTLMAVGLLGQLAYTIMDKQVTDPWYEQYWVFKDFGMFVFVMGFIIEWVKLYQAEQVDNIIKQNQELREQVEAQQAAIEHLTKQIKNHKLTVDN